MAMLAGKTHPGGSRTAASEYLLGLDIGTTSIGWAFIALRNDEPCGILRAGVRCFEAGVEGDIEKGKDSSRARPRRIARLARRARQCIRAAMPTNHRLSPERQSPERHRIPRPSKGD
jgi:CRISPR/Cas system Type II protein with McrA/HNH and RuvC-like nuclease domain